ncbi:MAG: hypothetical protein P1V36_16325, partial [Planctomycetota bacterium]|nr:hypothetical protein [Planctomycetota bacterium]
MAWLLVGTILGIVPFVFFLLASPLLTPWLRARTRRRLGGEPAVPTDAPTLGDVPATGTIFVAAGEASGDELAASVIRRIRAEAPGVTVLVLWEDEVLLA